MKYAVITDVHSNVFALEAALKKIDELRPDKIICLGDIVGNGFIPKKPFRFFARGKTWLALRVITISSSRWI